MSEKKGYQSLSKETLILLQSYIGPQTVIEGDFKISHFPTDKSSRQKLNRKLLDFVFINHAKQKLNRKMFITDVINQIKLKDIYRPFHPDILQKSRVLSLKLITY